ncbi:S41 family peptidase [Chitinispirillales bacterium ANBcel5]|uniref:S41 family peptidase n=1 Tax=Cellulosispirillum alkaliphilum TaxID=3039283 RepID=UPI002A560C48|nr:S41 family peptidase [Chitinispirillales bacterium ANBcel5]
MTGLKYSASVLFFTLLIYSCAPVPTQPQNEVDVEYEFAWDFLNVFFLFQERLPEEPFQFESPTELYESVNEPYTVYYAPGEREDLDDMLTTSSVGLGIRIDSVENGFVITEVFPQSPADEAGLRENDTIIAVDGVDVRDFSYDQFMPLIDGQRGDQVTITVRRNSETVDITVTLDRFVAPSVFVDSLDENIAYIYISSFFSSTIVEGGTAQEFQDALNETQWAEITILDLRDNPGGEVEPCVLVTSQFLEPGTPIVETRERRLIPDTVEGETVESTWVALDVQNNAIDREFILLVNEFTASASEILVSSLLANRDDIISVGSTTFGKGRGQALSVTPRSGLAVVTYAMLEPANGVAYDMIGIEPTVEVQEDEDPLEVALEIAENNLARYTSDIRFRYLRRIFFLHQSQSRRVGVPLSIIRNSLY